MLTNFFSRQKIAHMAIVLGMTLLLVTACDTGKQAQNNPPATPTSSTVTSASAIIRHSPSGIAILQWDHKLHNVSMQISLTGLAPDSTHPLQIMEGSCKNPGKALYNLSALKATSIGFSDLKTTITGVSGGIPESGWSLNVSNGPSTTAKDEAMSIACANIFNPTISTKADQNVQATLLNSFSPEQNITGTASLYIMGKELVVRLLLKGLTPGSKHMVHIHHGSCASQGPAKFELGPIPVGTYGSANVTTVVAGVNAIPRNGWYILVHLTNSEDGMKSQAGNDPIACGDITKIS